MTPTSDSKHPSKQFKAKEQQDTIKLAYTSSKVQVKNVAQYGAQPLPSSNTTLN